MVNVFESLLASENLVDVTIAVEGRFLKAHKIVLSACSPYFQSMFLKEAPIKGGGGTSYPVLIFHDMKFAHLKTLLDFMYRGEISIDEKDLGEVLKVAEALSIRGLSSFESDDEEDGSNNNQNANKGDANSSSNNVNANGNQSSQNQSSSSTQQSSSSLGSEQNDSTNHNNSATAPNPIQSTSNNNNNANQSKKQQQNSNHHHSKSNGTKSTASSKSNFDNSSARVRRDSPSPSRSSSVHHSNNVTAIAQQLDKAVVESKIFEKKARQQQQQQQQQETGRKRSLSPPVKKKRGRHPKVKPTVEVGAHLVTSTSQAVAVTPSVVPPIIVKAPSSTSAATTRKS
jgi:Cys2His2 zinc finger developmental/cell cycle regulator